MKIRRQWRAGVLLIGLAAMVVPATTTQDVAHAGSGLNTYNWGSAGVTISSSSYQYSNMTGFIQTLINSLGDSCTVTNDGIYGSVTTWWAAVLENTMLNGYNSGGVMSPYWLAALFGAYVPGTPDRALVDQQIYDAYATAYHYYYTGGGSPAALGWNVFGSQWLFGQNPNDPANLVQAVPSRTISGVCF